MSELQINTTQNVNISFTTASLGERILAFAIDMLIILAYIYGALYILKLLGLNKFDDNWSQMAVTFMALLPAMLYTLVSEITMQGQTLGKKVMKIKVVKIDGYQANIFDYFTRWIFRLIDIFLAFGTGAIALLTIAMSKNAQRFGDMASGTAIISIKNLYNIKSTILEDVDEKYEPVFPSVINLSDNDMRIIKETYQKALKNRDAKLFEKLRIKVEEITQTKQGTHSNTAYLRIIMKDYTHFTQNM